MCKWKLLAMSLIVLPPIPCAMAADKIYKSVDEQGNVIYSEKPIAGKTKSKRIAVPPPPSAEDVRRAEEEARRTKERADAMEAERKAREARQAAERVPPEGEEQRQQGGMSDAEKATSLSEHPQLAPEELEKYLKDQGYVPTPPAPTSNPPPR